MCGIAGILHRQEDQRASLGELQAMIGRLRHRGPDGEGFFQQGPVGLAHARLSIIDLNTGDQPIHNEDRTVWVIFNGEIFNYRELRVDLEQRGHHFYTQSDTEVIVHLYEQYDREFVNHLNGQFCIALWDTRAARLLLVRDRVGILPLFYTEVGDRLVFASEIKAMLALDEIDARLDPEALDQLMTFWAPVSPRTLFKGIREIPPGCLMDVRRSGTHEVRYWDYEFPDKNGFCPVDERQAADELSALLEDAIRIRLRADVPVGAYLSGGLDSSSLVAFIAGQRDIALNTFSIGFEDEALDERNYQRILLDRINAEHHEVLCRHKEVAAGFPLAVWHAEAPMLRTAPVPMAILSRNVREHGTRVVLTGEGADEVLGGYDLFKEDKIRRFWAVNPESKIRPRLLKRLYPYLDLGKGQTLVYLQQFFGRDLMQTDSPFYAHFPRWQTTAGCKQFFSADFNAQLQTTAMEAIESLVPTQLASWHPFNRAQYIESKSLMAGYLLCSQGDRMLMANSVEGRFPFLDHRLIAFASKLPPRLKMRTLNEKYLLKQAVRGRVPDAIRLRYKQPYRAPDGPSFFRDGTPDYVDELLSERLLREYGYFDSAKVGRLLAKLRRNQMVGAKDNMAIVGVLSTQIWHRQFVEGRCESFVEPINRVA